MNRQRYAPDGSSSVEGFWRKAIAYAEAVEKQERELAVVVEQKRLSVAHEKERIAREAKERAVAERAAQIKAERQAQAEAEAAELIEAEAVVLASKRRFVRRPVAESVQPVQADQTPEGLGRRFVRLVTGY